MQMVQRVAAPQVSGSGSAEETPAKKTGKKGPQQQRGKAVEAGEAPPAKNAKKSGRTSEDERDLAGLDSDGRKLLSGTIKSLQSSIRDSDSLASSLEARHSQAGQLGESSQAFEAALKNLQDSQAEAKRVRDGVAAQNDRMKQALGWKPTQAEEKKTGLFTGIAQAFGFGKKKENVEAKPQTMEAILNEGSEMAADTFFKAKAARDSLKEGKHMLEGTIRVTSNDRKLAVRDWETLGVKLLALADDIDLCRGRQAEIEKALGEKASMSPEHADLADKIVQLDQLQQWVGGRMQFFETAVENYDAFLSLGAELTKTTTGMLMDTDNLLQTAAVEQRSQDQLAAIVGKLAKVSELSANLRAVLVGSKAMSRDVLQYATGEYAKSNVLNSSMNTALRTMDAEMLKTAERDNATAEKARRDFVDGAVAKLRAGLVIADRPVHLAPDAQPTSQPLSKRVLDIDAALKTLHNR